MYGVYELVGGIQQAPGDSVAHFAHLGGMFFAFILIKFWGSQRDKFY
jgi:membrane associated rhomboid family serine protease